MATISKYQLKNGKTRYQYNIYAGTDKGTGQRKKIHRRGFTSYKSASDAAKLVEAEIISNKRNVTPQKAWNLGEFLDYWITHLKLNVKEGTRIVHRENIETYIKPRIGSYPLTEYTLVEHQRFINGLFSEKGVGRKKQGLSWATVKSINGTLSNALKKATQLGFIESNPTIGVEFSRKFKPQKRELRYYTLDEVNIFLETAKQEQQPSWFPFFLLMFDCGLRLGEDLALRWSRVDFNKRTLTIDQNRLYRAEADQKRQLRESGEVLDDSYLSITLDAPKTEHSSRNVPLTARAYTALLELRNKQSALQKVVTINPNLQSDPSSDFVFRRFYLTAGNVGEPISSRGAEGAMKRIAKNAGLKHLNVHGCRHSFAVRLREAGVDMENIRDLMGHVDLTTTRMYAEVTPKIKEDAMSKLEDYLNSSN
ncbi:site-specific integrase [Lactiplantibacillus plantarum]|uniref:site-specific integrase n=1 Tax=Lactiplantibacillus plantarum TaxID=1590 RepID=UPI002181FE86|nr:site-specific integrase [Lactiplantibacillus plantarum]MCS8622863.1 site-specific integrase [Lactiplantibacillus plantarum]